MSGFAVRLDGVGLRYSRPTGRFIRTRSIEHWALKDVSLDLMRGESLGVVGGNGTGKSTLLKVIAGILRQDGGRVVRTAKRIGFLSLQAGFIPHLSGVDNAVLGGMLLGLSAREARERVDEIAAFSELGSKLYDPLFTYSAGMRARLGLSTALAARPDVLLIDELLAVGDAPFRAKCAGTVKSVIRSDATVVLVSHNHETIRELCDRVVWLDGGRVQMVGGADAVLQAHAKSVVEKRDRVMRSSVTGEGNSEACGS